MGQTDCGTDIIAKTDRCDAVVEDDGLYKGDDGHVVLDYVHCAVVGMSFDARDDFEDLGVLAGSWRSPIVVLTNLDPEDVGLVCASVKVNGKAEDWSSQAKYKRRLADNTMYSIKLIIK